MAHDGTGGICGGIRGEAYHPTRQYRHDATTAASASVCATTFLVCVLALAGYDGRCCTRAARWMERSVCTADGDNVEGRRDAGAGHQGHASCVKGDTGRDEGAASQRSQDTAPAWPGLLPVGHVRIGQAPANFVPASSRTSSSRASSPPSRSSSSASAVQPAATGAARRWTKMHEEPASPGPLPQTSSSNWTSPSSASWS